MNYTSLTPTQLAEIDAANRAMLKLSRQRHADHLARQVADAESARVFGWSDLDAAKNLLAREFAKQSARRFSGATLTGFGAL